MHLGAVILAIVVTVIAVVAIRYALQTKGLTRLDRASRIVFASYMWLLFGGAALVLGTGLQPLIDIVSVVVIALLLPVLAFMLFAWVHRRHQQRIARRRDLKLGIPHQPRPRSWEAAGFIALYSACAFAAMIFAAASFVWAITEALQPGTAAMPDVLTVMSAGIVPSLIGGALLGLAWKLPRDRAVQDSIDLQEGIQSLLRAEREIGWEQGYNTAKNEEA